MGQILHWIPFNCTFFADFRALYYIYRLNKHSSEIRGLRSFTKLRDFFCFFI